MMLAMLDFMHDGGFMMWPLLALGIFSIVAAARRALHGGEGLVDPARLSRAVLAGSLAWFAMGLIVTSRGGWCDMTQSGWRMYVIGVGESLSPAVLGLTVYAIVGAIGSLSPARLSKAG